MTDQPDGGAQATPPQTGNHLVDAALRDLGDDIASAPVAEQLARISAAHEKLAAALVASRGPQSGTRPQ